MLNIPDGVSAILIILAHIETGIAPTIHLITRIYLFVQGIISGNRGESAFITAVGGNVRKTFWPPIETCCNTELLLVIKREPIHEDLSVEHREHTRHLHLLHHTVTFINLHDLLHIVEVFLIVADIDFAGHRLFKPRQIGDTATQTPVLTKRCGCLNVNTRRTQGGHHIQMLKGTTPVERLIILLWLDRRHILGTD